MLRRASAPSSTSRMRRNTVPLSAGGSSSATTWASVRGMVADLISTHFSNAVLIEAALNGFDQYLVVENSAEFFARADALADFPGRVRAICVDQLPPFIDGRDFSQQEGFVAYAMDLVRYAPEDERLVLRRAPGIHRCERMPGMRLIQRDEVLRRAHSSYVGTSPPCSRGTRPCRRCRR